MTLSWLAGGFFQGVSSGAACAGMCGCMLLPLILGRRGTLGSNVFVLALFSLGRLAAYLMFGTLAGMLGATLSTQPWYVYLQPAGHAVAAVLILRWLAAQSHCDRFAHAGGAASHVPLILGFMSGVRLCGPVVGALAEAATAGSVLQGIAFFAAFFLGTTLYLLPMPFAGLLAHWPVWTRVGRLAGATAGFVYLYAAASGVFHVLHPPPQPHDVAAYHALCPQAIAFKDITDEGILAAMSGDVAHAYLADTRFVADCPAGYGGPTPLVLVCDTNGVVTDTVALPNHESPGYVAKVTATAWWRDLRGTPLSRLGVEKPDAVSGATMTSDALHGAVRAAAERLAPLVGNQRTSENQAAMRPTARDYGALAAFLALAAVAVAMARSSRLRMPWLRWTVWTCAVILLGFVRADYFSIAQVGSLIRGTTPPWTCLAWYAVLAFALVSPLFWGRVYCAYLCPFGVISDAMGRATGFRLTLPGWCVRTLRVVRFALLLAAVALAAMGTRVALDRFEPFHALFIRPQPTAYIVFCATVLAVSCVVKRFWCALFCIDGALFEFIGRFRWNGRNRKPGGGTP